MTRYPVAVIEAFRLASADTAEACRYGHHDCAEAPDGDCSGEALAVLIASGLDMDDLETLAGLDAADR